MLFGRAGRDDDPVRNAEIRLDFRPGVEVAPHAPRRIALPGLGANRIARSLNRVYVEVVRAIPILVLILWVYYGMPQLADLSISVFWAGVIALALSDSAFQAEIFRAGIQSIGRRQYEAAHSTRSATRTPCAS